MDLNRWEQRKKLGDVIIEAQSTQRKDVRVDGGVNKTSTLTLEAAGRIQEPTDSQHWFLFTMTAVHP